jgi:hypothetical protein
VQRSSSRDDVQTPVKTPKLLRQLVRHTWGHYRNAVITW